MADSNSMMAKASGTNPMPEQKHSTTHHMKIHWHQLEADSQGPALGAGLREKASLIGRIGLMLLATGTGAWRVREGMNIVARALGVTASADIGLVNINLTCFNGNHHYTQALSLTTSGVNTDRMMALEQMLDTFEADAREISIHEFHLRLDEIEKMKANYTCLSLGLAAALACAAFCFLLGGGIFEMLCTFIGACVGQYIRAKMLRSKITLSAAIFVSVGAACACYIGAVSLLEMLFHIPATAEAGYLCSMLFVIPGFPLITGGIDISKVDMRSGKERLSYAILMILVATLASVAVALILKFSPQAFAPLTINPVVHCLLRLVASFCGVYGFSYLYNSPRKMAATAGLVGMIANTLRLELVSLFAMPAGMAALIGALVAGLLASYVHKKAGYPRISLTVPSIVIMVPGMFMYRSFYFLSVGQVDLGLQALTTVLVIALALPSGLVMARILTDKQFRTVD